MLKTGTFWFEWLTDSVVCKVSEVPLVSIVVEEQPAKMEIFGCSRTLFVLGQFHIIIFYVSVCLSWVKDHTDCSSEEVASHLALIRQALRKLCQDGRRRAIRSDKAAHIAAYIACLSSHSGTNTAHIVCNASMVSLLEGSVRWWLTFFQWWWNLWSIVHDSMQLTRCILHLRASLWIPSSPTVHDLWVFLKYDVPTALSLPSSGVGIRNERTGKGEKLTTKNLP